MCRRPIPSQCPHRNSLQESCLQNQSTIPDDLPPSWQDVCRLDRAKVPWVRPRISARLPSPDGSHSAAGWRGVSAPRSGAGIFFPASEAARASPESGVYVCIRLKTPRYSRPAALSYASILDLHAMKREYPSAPLVGVGAVIIQDGLVLL